MSRHLIVLLSVAAMTTAVAGCDAGPDRPGVTVFPDMRASVPYEAYDAHPVLPGGMTAMLPPEGTVAIDARPFPYGVGDLEAERAGRELVNPLDGSDPADLVRGKQVFETMCFACHGLGGEGDGPVIGRFPNPPSLLSAHTRSYPDGRIVHVITRGQGLMPAHAAQVLPLDRWRVVLHLRELQRATPAPEPLPPIEPAPDEAAIGADAPPVTQDQEDARDE